MIRELREEIAGLRAEMRATKEPNGSDETDY